MVKMSVTMYALLNHYKLKISYKNLKVTEKLRTIMKAEISKQFE